MRELQDCTVQELSATEEAESRLLLVNHENKRINLKVRSENARLYAAGSTTVLVGATFLTPVRFFLTVLHGHPKLRGERIFCFVN